jgi:indole-3-glycerol phosphate synthase
VLSRIYAAKAATLAQEMAREPYCELERRASARRGERRPFLRHLRGCEVGLIAEVKRASPSAGVIASEFDPITIARAYEAAGANAVSVLTESEHFLGDLSHLDVVRRATRLPILRKDFLWTRYHIAQAAAYGADCVLLIVAGMSESALRECLDEARRYALDALVEIHHASEIDRAVAAGATFVGVNNRDLQTFAVDLRVGERLLPKIPRDIFAISESGIRRGGDAAALRAAGARGFLIGEAMMRSENASAFIADLRQACRRSPVAGRVAASPP